MHKASVYLEADEGGVITDVTNRDGQSAKVSVPYDIDLSCSVTNRHFTYKKWS